MQTRPYPTDERGRRVWLNRTEQDQLLEVYRDEKPKRYLSLQLGLHGLRSNEIPEVARKHFRMLDGADDAYKLVVPDGKTGKRETPVSPGVRRDVTTLTNFANLRKDDPIIDVSTKTLRNWMESAREQLAVETGNDDWLHVGMHDLRRTWATDTFYSLAFNGVPIAEELTMGWGGWEMTSTGRETFRQNYLGQEPDHIAAQAMDLLPTVG